MSTDTSEIKLHFLDYWRVLRVRLPLILLVFVLVVTTTGIITYFLPRQYESKVTLEVKQANTSLEVFGQTQGPSVSPRFLTTQFEIIQRKEILNPVIESLGLENAWRDRGYRSKEQCYYKLRSMIDVREVRNAELIQITVLDTDRKEGMEIANRIAEEYQRKRISEQQQWVSRSLAQLDDEVAKQRKKVDGLRAEMGKIRTEEGIQDLNPDSVEDPLQAQERVLMSVEEQVSSERLKVSMLRAKFQQISQMTDDQIMRGINTLEVEDQTVTQILPQYQDAIALRAELLNSGLGKNHPLVKSLQAKTDVFEKQLSDQIGVLRTTLANSLNISEESLKNLEGKLNDSRKSQQDAKTRAGSYYEAKNSYIQAKKLLEAAEMRLSTETMQRAMPQSPTTIWEYAVVAEGPSRPRVLLNMALGVAVGLVLGVGLAFFIEYLDTSVKTMEDVENYLKVPVLAVVRRDIGILMNEPPDTLDAEAYRIMRTNIEFNRKSPDANAITLVSGGAGEGKSTTLANLAFIFAKGGYNTLVVDADLRRPTQHKIFGTSNDRGLTDYLTTDLELEDLVMATKVENLCLMTSGRLPQDAVGVLNSQRMVDLIEKTKNRFDVVFFDSPPVLGVSDASVLASAVDLTIIVVQHRRFPRALLQRVKQSVLNVGGNILGVVLNNVDTRHDQNYEYYTSYYNYYHTPTRAEKKEAEKQAKSASTAAGKKETSGHDY